MTTEKPIMGGTRIARLHVRDSDTGALIDIRLDFDLWEAQGVLPDIGDLIVDPGVPAGRARDIPANRTVYKVVERYFWLNDPDRVALIVEERPGQDHEAGILWMN